MEPSLVKQLIWHTLHVIHANHRWMGWNLFLAIIPLLLSVVLFRRDQWLARASHAKAGHNPRRLPEASSLPMEMEAVDVAAVSSQRSGSRIRTPVGRSFWGVWTLTFLIFVAFLPNAPYILTDVIHLVEAIRNEDSIWLSSFVLIPVFLSFMFMGFESYVISLINLGHYLRQRGLGRHIVSIELFMHGLSAIGIYLGRFMRFNSWDILTNPDRLVAAVFDDLTGHQPILAILVSFILLILLYYPMKEVTLAVCSYRKLRRSRTLIDPLLLE